MMKNNRKRWGKRGNVFFGSILGLMCFIVGVLIIPFMTDDIVTTRADLNCTGVASITDGTKLTCLFTDIVIPYFIWFFVSLAVGIIGGMNK